MTTEAQVSQSYILYVFGADKCHPSFSYIDSFRTFYKNVRVVPSEAPIKLIYLGDTERLTTEMGERRGCENLTDHRNDVTWGLV